MADIPESANTTRIYVRWSDDGQHIRKWSREPFAEGEAIDAIGRAATDGEALSWRLDRIIEDGGPLTLSDKAILREAAVSLATRAAPPAMDREAVEKVREAASAMLPKNVCLTNPRWPDETVVPLETTLGDLRALSSALSTLSADAIRQGEGVAQFGAVVFQQVWDSFIDGGWDIEVNDLVTKDALKAGLVSVEPFDPKSHIDPSGAAQPGDDFYQLTDAGREAFATPDATPASHASDGEGA